MLYSQFIEVATLLIATSMDGSWSGLLNGK